MLNSLNYGWWEDNTLYQFTDPDHISFAASATEARQDIIQQLYAEL